MTTYTLVSIAAIAVYSVVCLYIGLGKGYNKEHVATARGYFVGGGTRMFILFFTTVATWFSTWIFMGAPGSFFTHGVGWIAGMTWQVYILVCMGYFGPRFWRMGIEKGFTTPGDLIEYYYDSKILRYGVGATQLIFLLPLLLAQISGVGLAISTLTGGYIPFWLGCVYTVTIIGLYVYRGGFTSQAWVDTVQGIFFLVIMWGSVVILLTRPQIGGLSGLFATMEQGSKDFLYFFTDATKFWNWKNYFAFSLVQCLGGFFAPQMWQRMYAAKTGKTLVKMAGVLSPVYCFLFLLPVLLIGFAGRVLEVAPANSDSILVTVMNVYMPYWSILVVLGIMAAGMSTISSVLISATSIFSVDFIDQRAKNKLDSQRLRDVGRNCVLVVLLLLVIAAQFKIPGIIILMNMAQSGLSQAFFPVLGIFVWKRASIQGVMAGFFGGTIAVILCYAANISPLGFHGGFWGCLINAVLFVSVSLATQPYSAAHRKAKLGFLEAAKNRPETVVL